jgi:hypothetical protein
MALVVVALILFAVAAVLGATMVSRRLGDKPIPLSLAAAHGAFAGLGLVVLLVAVGQGIGGLGAAALILFVLAALGGFYLFSIYLRKAPLPVSSIVVHGTIAVIGFVVLLIALVK